MLKLRRKHKLALRYIHLPCKLYKLGYGLGAEARVVTAIPVLSFAFAAYAATVARPSEDRPVVAEDAGEPQIGHESVQQIRPSPRDEAKCAAEDVAAG